MIQKVHKLSAGRFLVLITGDDDAGILPGRQKSGVLGAWPAGQHAGTGQKDHRFAAGEQFFPVSALYRSDGLYFLCIERFISFQDPSAQCVLQKRRVAGVHGVDIPDHAVCVDRDCRNLLILYRSTQNQEDLLCASKGKSRDQDLLFLKDAFPYQFDQPVFFDLTVGVQPVSVGGFGRSFGIRMPSMVRWEKAEKSPE